MNKRNIETWTLILNVLNSEGADLFLTAFSLQSINLISNKYMGGQI